MKALEGLIVLIVIFVIAREFFCWYWKFNRMVDALERIVFLMESDQVAPPQVAQFPRPKSSPADVLEQSRKFWNR